MWLSATANKSAAGVFTGTLYRTTGPAFNALPFSPSQVVATPVGTLTLSFASGDTATFAYVVNGVSQSKTITRQVFRDARYAMPMTAKATAGDFDARIGPVLARLGLQVDGRGRVTDPLATPTSGPALASTNPANG